MREWEPLGFGKIASLLDSLVQERELSWATCWYSLLHESPLLSEDEDPSRVSTVPLPHSLRQIDSQRASEQPRDLNFLQVMEKESTDSTGRSWRMEII